MIHSQGFSRSFLALAFCPGNFQQTGIAVAVPKSRPAALKIASELLQVAKTSGLVRRALDAAGFPEAVVAP
jgi:polar amino acid transport system substrate-binding protein